MIGVIALVAQEAAPAAPGAPGAAAATVAVSLALVLAGIIWVRCSKGNGEYTDVLLGGMFVTALAGSSVIAQIFTTANELVLSGIQAIGDAAGF